MPEIRVAVIQPVLFREDPLNCKAMWIQNNLTCQSKATSQEHRNISLLTPKSLYHYNRPGNNFKTVCHILDSARHDDVKTSIAFTQLCVREFLWIPVDSSCKASNMELWCLFLAWTTFEQIGGLKRRDLMWRQCNVYLAQVNYYE